MEKKFDRQALAEFDGRQEKPAYVARDGVVYDVSASQLWKDGGHMKRHQAGRDLSADFMAAPHGAEVFERVTAVGVLVGEGGPDPEARPRPAWLRGLLERFPLLARHPHPLLVHFSIAFMFAAPLFALLALFTGRSAFESTAFHCLGAGVLATPLAIGSGLFTWWLNYQARLLKPIKIKLIGASALMLLSLLLFLWRLTTPELLVGGGGPRSLYLLLLMTLIPMVSVVGWYGAALTFPPAGK